MDLYKAIQELTAQKRQIDLAIATLEALIRGETAPPKSRRGRKNMSEAERRVVSERMRAYWASRRNSKGGKD